MRLFITALVELVRSWWNSDRVRVSPWEGRLLRISAGAFLSVEDELWEVTGRFCQESEGGPLVRYRCRGQHGDDGEIWIPVEPDGSIYWRHQGITTELIPDQIKVWGQSAFAAQSGR